MEDFMPNDEELNSNEPEVPRWLEPFIKDLDTLICRYYHEYDISVITMVGCLELQKQLLLQNVFDEAKAVAEEEAREAEEHDDASDDEADPDDA